MKRRDKHLLAALIGVLGFSAIRLCPAADGGGIPTPPPMARPQTVTVQSGKPAQIQLRVAGRVVEPLTFLIRSAPRLGSLGPVQRTGRNTAVVTYFPSVPQGEDGFSFAAQSIDSPVSAPARVRITIEEEPPAWDFSHELDFGTTWLGDVADRTLMLRNTGGGVAVGRLELEPPWSVSGDKAFQAARSEELEKTITFFPTEERDYLNRLIINNDPKNILTLKGRAIAPLTWAPDELTLDSTVRKNGSVVLRLQNKTSEVRRVDLQWPDFARAPKSVSVPAGGAIDVRAEIPEREPASFAGAVKLRSGGFAREIPLKIFPGPPELEMPASLQFGSVPLGRAKTVEFVIRNRGTGDATLGARVPEGLMLQPDPAGLILQPGQERVFELSVEPTRLQDIKTELVITCRQTPDRSISVSGKVVLVANHSMPTSQLAPTVRAIPEPAGAPEDNPSGVSEVAPIPATLEGWEGVQIAAQEPRRILLTWTVLQKDAVTFRVDRRSISPGEQGRVKTEWIPWQGGKVSVTGTAASADLVRLPPDTMWTVRVVPLDALGKDGEPSAPIRITTLPVKQFSIPDWFIALVISISAGGLFLVWRYQRRRRLAEHDARIDQLGKP